MEGFQRTIPCECSIQMSICISGPPNLLDNIGSTTIDHTSLRVYYLITKSTRPLNQTRCSISNVGLKKTGKVEVSSSKSRVW